MFIKTLKIVYGVAWTAFYLGAMTLFTLCGVKLFQYLLTADAMTRLTIGTGITFLIGVVAGWILRVAQPGAPLPGAPKEAPTAPEWIGNVFERNGLGR